MAIETLLLGVRGKACMWRALRQVADQYPPLLSLNLVELIERADSQYDMLDRERLATGARALAKQVPATA
jgi:hypothetical protein